MATTQTVNSVDQIKGNSTAGEQHVYQIPVTLAGTYLTASKPNFSILSALQAAHGGITAVNVKRVALLRDYNDGTNRYTAPNANLVLSTVASGSTNDVLTFRVDSGATNGTAGSEVADATALNGVFVFLVVAEVTGA